MRLADYRSRRAAPGVTRRALRSGATPNRHWPSTHADTGQPGERREPSQVMVRPMVMRRTGTCFFLLIVLLSAATGCTSGDKGNAVGDAPARVVSTVPPDGATVACANALPDKRIASSSATTVGEVRALIGGPGRHIFPSAFPGSEPRAVAYYCYSDEGAKSYEGFAVHDAEAILGVRLGGLDEIPFGPPILP